MQMYPQSVLIYVITSILGPLLFIMYINDIAHARQIFDFIIYVNDTNLTSSLKILLKETKSKLSIELYKY